MMTDSRLLQLEELANQRASGQLSDEQLSREKAKIMGGSMFHEEASSQTIGENDYTRFMGFVLIAFGVALFHFNGWSIVHPHAVSGFGSDQDFFIGLYEGGRAYLLRVGTGWVGFARTNIAALVIDAPLINVVALVGSIYFVLFGLKAIVWPSRARQ